MNNMTIQSANQKVMSAFDKKTYQVTSLVSNQNSENTEDIINLVKPVNGKYLNRINSNQLSSE
ncbi:MAG: hypothetical protein ACJAS3_003533 [Roseivirga sp.]|jgi:hypothetical protein